MLVELIEKRNFLSLPSMQVYGKFMRDLKWDKHPYCPQDINSNFSDFLLLNELSLCLE